MPGTHPPNILVGGTSTGISPQYHYVLSDIADQYWLPSVRSASSRFHSAIRRHQFAAVRQADGRLTIRSPPTLNSRWRHSVSYSCRSLDRNAGTRITGRRGSWPARPTRRRSRASTTTQTRRSQPTSWQPARSSRSRNSSSPTTRLPISPPPDTWALRSGVDGGECIRAMLLAARRRKCTRQPRSCL